MAILVSTSAGNRTVTITYTSTIAKVDTTLSNASQDLYLQGYGDQTKAWSSMTNQEKLNVVDDFVKKSIVAIANGFYKRSQIASTTATIDTTNNAQHGLE